MRTVAIVGAGITGLTAAFYLKRKGVPVTVYEAGDRVGGAIQSIRAEGYLAEFGPNTILETSPKVAQLVRDAGLASRRLDPDPRASARYVVRYQRPIAMPGSPLGFFATHLFTARAKLAVLREPFVPPRRDGKEESVAEFVLRRLGREFLDHAIDALVAGVYAGDPYKLSVPQAFPKLGQLEARYGSLIKGQLFGARERKRRGEIAKDRAPKFSFDGGLQVLPDTLREGLGEAVRLHTTVTRLTQTPDGWTLDLRPQGRQTRAEHSAVVYAGTAFKLAELEVQSAVPLHFNTFAGIRYPPVASVVLGFRREDVAHPCEGFGMLIPKVEGFKILGTIFSSSLFPNRAPAGCLTLTSYVGGERNPELASLPPEKLFALTCEDLRVLLGVHGRPTFEHSVYYPHAIPQYNVGYGQFRELMTDIEQKAPGLFFAGHYRDGISLSDTIMSGCKVADRVEEYLASATHRTATMPA
ncbi:MAG TPA: protoporphyrinogen oxidase [Candidatus Paceibacterota bacterium]|nr:protoporphyrinogen oxidase [Verrucomicrobiota bacterium]HSA09526.1 protoporphyrinogen oxidase [Candidatus Paceibacterota bacterium]